MNSTSIAARLDPEEWKELVDAYHQAAAQAIERFGGHVAQYLGDGIMAYFGWPEAHDNDAERAVRAGLAILDSISKLKDQPERPRLSARVGIHSGAVVVGAGIGKGAGVFGETPNIASRVQAAAVPDSVLITAATHRLVSGMFVVEAREAQTLKGIPRPVGLFHVVRPTGVRGRLGAAPGLTPFVGREDELQLLLTRWQQARGGEGQLVLVIGEAGIGKSRLVAEFHHRIRDTPNIWLECAGEQLFENSPFRAVIEMLSQWLELQGGTNVDEHVRHLERALASAGLKLDEATPLITDLLQVPLGRRYPALILRPEEKRRRLLSVLSEWLFGAARLQPAIMVVEDLHWLDPSTLELLKMLAEQGGPAPLMLVYTARPEFRAQWHAGAHHTQVELNQLNSHNAQVMISQLIARHAIPSETLDLVIERTGGVPLFIEELTRAVLETGDSRPGAAAIPETLHDSLMARLDRLGTAKEVAQLAAVIGSECSYELLLSVSSKPESELQSALSKLADAGLVYAHGSPSNTSYRFKHALIRDAAYHALLRSRRRELHRVVAQTIDEKFSVLKETQPAVLAHHWTEAGETELAINQWSRAGKAMEVRNAFHEAEENYGQALGLLALLPESSERDGRELRFRQSLVSILHLTRGWTAPETVAATERLEMLARRSGNLRQLIGSMTTRCLHAYIGGELRAAGALADEALDLAQLEPNRTTLAYLHMLEVGTRYHCGNLSDAEKHFAEGLEFFDDGRFRQDPNGGPIAVYGAAALNAWVLGHPQTARERIAKLMGELNSANPQEVAHADWYAALLYTLMRDSEQAERLATRGLELCEKHKFPNVAAYLRCILGEIEGSVALIDRGIAELRKMGSRIAITSCVTALASVQYRVGALDEALKAVEYALNANPEELVYRPETLRVRGELRLAIGQADHAEADFQDSITMARSMGAKAWELRTIMSLARLLQDIGRRDEAQSTLADIYNRFTEGFDTADLKQANALLDELSQ
ncbi:MAG: AAA family ATPase [Deltaproteobacteria bacterium]|nr:AAA family ATPase [Deltaproteobacteria bacterium]